MENLRISTMTAISSLNTDINLDNLYKNMDFTFSGMVTEDIDLTFPTEINEHFAITDTNNKEYLDVKVAGDNSSNEVLTDSLTKAYVAFSGHTFPQILVKLMQENNVMINPTRPMIMSVSFAGSQTRTRPTKDRTGTV